MIASTNVASNVRHLRRGRGLTLAELSDRLTEVGHPIGLKVLSKIELEERRVDVNDLTALASALGVTPMLLLADPACLTNDERQATYEAWGDLQVVKGRLERRMQTALATTQAAIDAISPLVTLPDL